MTLDATKPTDQALNALWPSYIRAIHSEINSLLSIIGSGIIVPEYNAVAMAAGATSLTVGTEIADVGYEVIGLTGAAAVNLTTILNGTAGQVKVIIALDNNITVIQGATATTGGVFYLNSPVGVNLAMQTRDILSVINIGGDGSSVDGYWLEFDRKLQI